MLVLAGVWRLGMMLEFFLGVFCLNVVFQGASVILF